MDVTDRLRHQPGHSLYASLYICRSDPKWLPRCSSSVGSQPPCSSSTVRIRAHVAVRSAFSTRQSRATFRSSFACQYSLLDRGVVPCSGHRCQKQPMTKTATRARGKTTSGRTRSSSVLIAKSTRNLSPRRCNADRTAISGLVSRRRFPCITRRTPADEAVGGEGSLLTAGR